MTVSESVSRDRVPLERDTGNGHGFTVSETLGNVGKRETLESIELPHGLSALLLGHAAVDPRPSEAPHRAKQRRRAAAAARYRRRFAHWEGA